MDGGFDDGGRSRWLRAVELGGRGEYAAAETLLRALRAGPGVGPAVRAHASVTRASHLRQVGAHGDATRYDADAARIARAVLPTAQAPGSAGTDVAGVGAAAAFGDALTGLAADAVGRWDAATAERLLRRAAPWCGVDPDGTAAPVRTGVRWLWVRAEVYLLLGDAPGAVGASGDAVVLAGALGSARHSVKSRLVHAVARSVAGQAPDAVAELDALADEAGSAGLLPLRWPALLAAADAAERAGPATDERRPDGRHAGPSATDTVGRRTVAQSRRHAAMLTTSALYLRSDPVARARMRESAWMPLSSAVPL